MPSARGEPFRSVKEMDDKGKCEHCGESFSYRLIHNGFNESAYAYCGTCGMTALLDGWQMPSSIAVPLHQCA
jgi:transcription elongation factor Elf1